MFTFKQDPDDNTKLANTADHLVVKLLSDNKELMESYLDNQGKADNTYSKLSLTKVKRTTHNRTS